MKLVIALLTAGALTISAPLFAKPSKKSGAAKTKKTTKTDAATGASEEGASEAAEMKSYSRGAYGMAGCGLGSMVIKDDSIMQIFAVTTNGTSANQTFGITTGTSNCKPGSKKMASIEQKVFVEANFAELSREAAQGDGEHLRAFAELLGCDHDEFLKFSKANREVIFAQPETVIEAVKSSYQGQCARVG
jgi:hypothetical protein